MYTKVQPAKTAENEDECFVTGALAVVLRVSRYLGTASLRFARKDDGWRISQCAGLSLFSGLIITVTGLLNLGTNFSDKLYSIEQEDRIEWSGAQRLMRFSESLLMVVIAVWMVYNEPAHTKDLIRCLNQVQKIHKELKIKQWPKQQKMHIALFILWMTLCVIVTVSDYFAVSVFVNQSPVWIKVLEFLYYIHYAVIQTRVLQFVLVVIHVKSNFESINDYLTSLLKDVESKKQKEGCLLGNNSVYKTKEDSIKVNNYINSIDNGKLIGTYKESSTFSDTFHTISSAYGATCCVMRALNRAEGMMLMLMLAFLFQHLMSTPYFLITNIIYGEYVLDERFYMFYGSVLTTWTCLHLFNLTLIIEPCHMTHLEMEKTRELVSHLMRCTDSAHDPLMVDLDLLYKNVIANNLYYKPLNVVTICRGLVIEILGGVTTYLVILVKIK